MAPPALPPVDKIDPARAWQPWQPSAADPWGPKWAGHLYRRAAFGGNLTELRRAVAAGHTATIDLLMKGEPKAAGLYPSLTQWGREFSKEIGNLRGWWVYFMLNGGHPLRERMTLFWHNHFATSVAKVTSVPLMYKQNVLLRQHALGKFEPFLQAMSKDPAMLRWLDSNSNIKGRANENYAREVMELFSLGVHSGYTEKDIREAARAFTGWGTNGDDYEFNAYFHDTGTKTILGRTGNFNGEDIVRIVLQRPVTARFLVRKLYRNFLSEQHDPPDALIEPLADSFRKSDYDVAQLMRTMLSSRHFFSDYAFRQRIKSPVEYVLGSVRAVYRAYPEKDPNYSKLPIPMLVSRIDAMGQPLFAPPNVKGWRGAEAWLTTSTLLARQNFAQAVAMGTLWPRQPAQAPLSTRAAQVALAEAEAQRAQDAKKPKPKAPAPPTKPEEDPPAKAFDPARVIGEEKVTKPEEVVRLLLDVYLPGGVSPAAQTKLIAFVAKGNPAGRDLERRAREAVQAILGMPESQLA
ncbi:MAG TPA: DUF1800 domain-containing protein [Gemmataceae bacterium]|nr:DUF1800 domain-containing protein [Gemmataceae bacterium]